MKVNYAKICGILAEVKILKCVGMRNHWLGVSGLSILLYYFSAVRKNARCNNANVRAVWVTFMKNVMLFTSCFDTCGTK
jgi:hypothetical protein